MTQQEYIQERIEFFAQNIDEFSIGDVMKDKDGAVCVISNMTINTIEVIIPAKTKKGITCKQWFDMKEFNKRFKKYVRI